MNNFKRIAAFAIGLGSGIAAGYLSRPRLRNKLRNQIVGFPTIEEELTKKKEEMDEKSTKSEHATSQEKQASSPKEMGAT